MSDDTMSSQLASDTLPQDPPANSDRAVAADCVGALDIVEAFTSLRHELKLQVRNGRELQQSLNEGVQRIEQRLTSRQMAIDSSAMPDEMRKLAEAFAEVEESLQRAVDNLAQRVALTDSRQEPNVLERFDRAVQQAPWLARKFASATLHHARSSIAEAVDGAKQTEDTFQSTRRGLELLLSRIHRLMQQCDIERVDVLHEPFDAEAMQAMDIMDAPSVPSTHVAEQIRPAYYWRGKILRCANVRLAK